MTEKNSPPPPRPTNIVEGLPLLRAPFPDKCYGKLMKGGTALDYVGHAHVTDRLLSIDPNWNWEPVAWTPEGLPAIRTGPKVHNLWIKLTVLDKTVLGVGTCELGKAEPEKELIGDALRNAAMRLGVALDLWAKSELESEMTGPTASVNKTTGELTAPAPKLPPKPAAKPAAARTVTTTTTTLAPGDLASTIDVSALPDAAPDENGITVLWGIPVTAQEFDNWTGWAGECPIPAKFRDTSRSCLVEHTYASAIRGTPGGKREMALRWTVANEAAKVQSGKGLRRDGLPWPEAQRAAVALYQMILGRETDADFIQPTPDELDENDAPF
jgi:hypothetical protein